MDALRKQNAADVDAAVEELLRQQDAEVEARWEHLSLRFKKKSHKK